MELIVTFSFDTLLIQNTNNDDLCFFKLDTQHSVLRYF